MPSLRRSARSYRRCARPGRGDEPEARLSEGPDRKGVEMAVEGRGPVLFVDYVMVVWRHVWLVVGICVVVVAVVATITLKTPKVYESTATLLVPREGGSPFSRLGSFQLTERLVGLTLPATPNRDLLLGLLRS